MPHSNICTLLETIGNTPLTELTQFNKTLSCRLYAKLEFMNPGGSIKDRVARYMVEKAEADGRLQKGQILLENSSGNTAMGLALVALQKGYRCTIVIRDSTSREKIRMLQHLGAETLLVDATLPPDHPQSYNNYARHLAAKDKRYFYVDQHNNLDNNEAHYHTTGPEIWRQCSGQIDYLVCGVGTGGTIFGAGRYLKEQRPQIKLIGVDPEGSVFYNYFHKKQLTTPRPYLLEGLGDEFLLPTAPIEQLDDMIRVGDQTAFSHTLQLAATEGIIAGGSSGAALYGALTIAGRAPAGSHIITIFPDSGYKYASSIFA